MNPQRVGIGIREMGEPRRGGTPLERLTINTLSTPGQLNLDDRRVRYRRRRNASYGMSRITHWRYSLFKIERTND